MQSLQSITDAWGNWFAGTLGTSLNWTCSTNYGDHGELNGWDRYQVSASYQGISYGGNSPPTNAATVAYELWYDNSTSVVQSNSFVYSSTTSESFTWSLTETLSIGVEISATEGVPNVASSSQKLTINFSLSSTQSQTVSSSQTWSVNSPVQVPATSSVKCDMVLNSQAYDINFTASVRLAGYVNVWFNDRVTVPGGSGEHYCWFIPIATVFQQVATNLPNVDTSGYQILGEGVLATVRGTFTGSQGISVGVTTTQYPLRSLVSDSTFAPVRKMQLALDAIAAE